MIAVVPRSGGGNCSVARPNRVDWSATSELVEVQKHKTEAHPRIVYADHLQHRRHASKHVLALELKGWITQFAAGMLDCDQPAPFRPFPQRLG